MRTVRPLVLCCIIAWWFILGGMLRTTGAGAVIEPANVPVKLPNDPYFPAKMDEDNWGQWQFYDMVNPDHSGDINLGQAWNIETGDGSVVLAFLDTGLRMDHEDLVENLWRNADGTHGWDFVDEDNDPSDALIQLGHGTLVAGFCAARGNNGIGIAGAIWNAKIMPLRTSSKAVFATAKDFAEALRYARKNGANIVNMSLGVMDYNEEAARELRACFDAGMILVAAAGNDGKNAIPLPNGDPRVITCGGCSIKSDALDFPNYGSDIKLVAPLVRPHTTFMLAKNSYYLRNADNEARGTSMAAPQVSAVTALVLSYRNRHPELPKLSNREVMALLYQTCDKIGNAEYNTDGVPWNERFGYGRVNAYAALTYGGRGDAFPEIKNMVVTRKEGSVLITYDLADDDGDLCDVKVEFRPSTIGKPPWKQNDPWKRGSTSPASKTGRLQPAEGLSVTWLASQDGVLKGQQYEVRLVPDDNKLFGFSGTATISF